ncbi:MAG: LamG domain-containing protein [Nitrosopumilus sp.]|uniref:LamG domain-containing protein n=1 Tax=Nitrosopumilus sp. TaxID=2024843 RepID=UPI00247B3F0D|nr:LamG domain-containing protein [Nitrosopumilus sp.]MCV0392278.1 LamG domain-containing protein [Nitrosopumilus sp.]
MIKRRGLSSVIGMIFLVVVLSSTIGYFTYGVNLIESLNDQIVIKSMETQNKIKESFDLSTVQIVNGKFNITLQNTGDLPINIARLWVKNVTDNTWPLQNFTVNKIVTPGEILTNVGQDVGLFALDTQAYDLKFVTERGNSKEFSVNAPGQQPLDIRLIALPQTVSDGFLTTLLMTVTNNMTNNNILLNLAPEMQTIQTTGTASYELISNVTPLQISSLAKGNTEYFTWTYKISGDVGNTVIFTTALQNGFPQNTASAQVTVNDVLLAQQSSTTLALNSGVNSPNKDQLVFHSETNNTPSGEYQMFSGDVDNGGMTISVETDNPKFFTNDGIAVSIPAGNWNASLTYYSSPFPDSLSDNNSDNMVLHFEGNISPIDSTGNTANHILGSGSNMPTYGASSGPHNSGAFSFNGNDYIELNSENENRVDSSPDTTALWFKGDDVAGSQILYRAYSANEYYEIGLQSDDNVYFTYLTQSGQTPTLCETSGGDYDNGNWQFITVVRATDHSCLLYINGTSVGITTTGSGSSSVSVSNIFVGAEDDTPNNGFNGVIDDIFHWNNYALSSSEIADLYASNYGDSAHLVTVSMNKTDENGVFKSNIVTDVAYPLKFLDGMENNDFLSSFNYTAFIANSVNFTSSERLVFGMNDVTGLDLNMRIDDTSLTGNPANSFLQYPSTSDIFASYLTFTASSNIGITVYNVGPSSIWLTYEGTRLTFEDVVSSNTYAAVILSGNSTTNGGVITSTQDSIAFPFNDILNLEFSTAKNPPATTGSTGLIPAGTYDMNLHITGYDINGKSITRTISFGLVTVT